MNEELVKRLRNRANGSYEEKCEGCEFTEDFPPCVHCTIKAFNDAADAIEELKKKNEQLTKKLVRPRPPKRKACSCGKKKWVQWYHTDTGMWSLQCDNCGKSSRQVKYQSQLNAAWNEIADSEIDQPKEET